MGLEHANQQCIVDYVNATPVVGKQQLHVPQLLSFNLGMNSGHLWITLKTWHNASQTLLMNGNQTKTDITNN